MAKSAAQGHGPSSPLGGRLGRGVFVLWVLLVYGAYFQQFDFYLAYAVRLLRRVFPLGPLQL